MTYPYLIIVALVAIGLQFLPDNRSQQCGIGPVTELFAPSLQCIGDE